MYTPDDVLGYASQTTEHAVVTGRVASLGPNGATVELSSGKRAILPRGETPMGRLPAAGSQATFLVLENSAGADVLSLTHPALIPGILSGLVPELRTGQARVMHTARLPGVRSKVAVAPTEEGVDAVAAMVGRSANRVQYLSSLLHGERVDIVRWSPDQETFLRNAFAPAAVEDTLIESGFAVVSVAPHLMSAAVGRGGLNTSLAGRLVGLRVVVVRQGQDLQAAMDALRDPATTA